MRDLMPTCSFCGIIIIVASGLQGLAHQLLPTPILFSLHPFVWWGALMGIASAICAIRCCLQKITSK